jgi:hypothetical protein
MVTFVSLFLWLMTGTHPVTVAVEGPVVAVEIFLDGEKVGVATPPKWTVDCDFGTALIPHELIAVALDDVGAELGRARQVVNLPRPRAEIEIVLEDGPSGFPGAVRVVSQSALMEKPESIEVTFDQQVLIREGETWPLPPFATGETHLVSAEAHFPEGVSARADVSFTGRPGSGVTTELTAVPVVVEGKRNPQAVTLEGRLRARGRALSISAVERPGARVYLVQDFAAWPTIKRIGIEMTRRKPFERSYRLEFAENLPPEADRFYIVVPTPTIVRQLRIFPIAGPLELRRFNLPWLVSHAYVQQASSQWQLLADAVAVAGVRAAGGGSPRAVVLLLGKGSADIQRSRAREVREYLAALHVPLVVWSTGDPGADAWGPAVDVASPPRLERACEHLLESLYRQWIVWVEGRYLPDQITLDEGVEGIRIAG